MKAQRVKSLLLVSRSKDRFHSRMVGLPYCGPFCHFFNLRSTTIVNSSQKEAPIVVGELIVVGK